MRFQATRFSLSSRLFTRSSTSIWIQTKSVVLKAPAKDGDVDSVTKSKLPLRSDCVFLAVQKYNFSHLQFKVTV